MVLFNQSRSQCPRFFGMTWSAFVHVLSEFIMSRVYDNADIGLCGTFAFK